MRYQVLALAFVLTSVSSPHACFKGIAPSAFAERCPIIIKGTIVAVAVAGPGKERADDQAAILVEEVQKNELKDVPVKVGEYFHVRMISRNNRLRMSTDLNYPLKTSAVWLVALTSNGQFRIDVHPVQKQGLAERFQGRGDLVKKVECKKDSAEEKNAGVRGTITTKEWIERLKLKEAGASKRGEAKRRAEGEATAKEVRDLARFCSQHVGIGTPSTHPDCALQRDPPAHRLVRTRVPGEWLSAAAAQEPTWRAIPG